ncbi:hypothetical protein G4G27_13345 [Sphingomonas sp. So64.6b]|uniref:hypothetical protein n=1 Tax=Sphingomonas sp. So64.6b TaxID=2997354 RepID=UPI0016004764|nr:hypothetical protein [Sphingomonas sp. So64.6b]QNA84871.1 hypothetical protein G4G27_13345 [Sphingomonas sp. So64.6b]
MRAVQIARALPGSSLLCYGDRNLGERDAAVEHGIVTPLWFIAAVCVVVALVPQLLTRSAGGDRMFGDAPWIDRAVRVGAIGTFGIFVSIYLIHSKA